MTKNDKGVSDRVHTSNLLLQHSKALSEATTRYEAMKIAFRLVERMEVLPVVVAHHADAIDDVLGNIFENILKTLYPEYDFDELHQLVGVHKADESDDIRCYVNTYGKIKPTLENKKVLYDASGCATIQYEGLSSYIDEIYDDPENIVDPKQKLRRFASWLCKYLVLVVINRHSDILANIRQSDWSSADGTMDYNKLLDSPLFEDVVCQVKLFSSERFDDNKELLEMVTKILGCVLPNDKLEYTMIMSESDAFTGSGVVAIPSPLGLNDSLGGAYYNIKIYKR